MVYFVICPHNDEVFKQYLLPGLQKLEALCCICTDQIPGIPESIFRK